MTNRLPAEKLLPTARDQVASFHADVVAEVAKAVGADAVVVVGMAQNPFVKRARKALEGAGIAFTYLEYGSYLSGWKPRLAIKLWSGFPTFPQVYVKGQLFGGAQDLEKAIADGSFQKLVAG
jgi:glutaredoxin-related protein